MLMDSLQYPIISLMGHVKSAPAMFAPPFRSSSLQLGLLYGLDAITDTSHFGKSEYRTGSDYTDLWESMC